MKISFKDNDIAKTCNEILEQWQTLKPVEPTPTKSSSEDLNEKLAKLLESQSLATTKQREYTEEEKKIRYFRIITIVTYY